MQRCRVSFIGDGDRAGVEGVTGNAIGSSGTDAMTAVTGYSKVVGGVFRLDGFCDCAGKYECGVVAPTAESSLIKTNLFNVRIKCNLIEGVIK